MTFAFALRGVFLWWRVPGYVIVQLAGALAAAATLRTLFGNEEHLGVTLPQHATTVALAMEVLLLTVMLVSVILGTSTQHRVVGPNAAIAVGATIIACNIFGKGESGAR